MAPAGMLEKGVDDNRLQDAAGGVPIRVAALA
jgi:hypothetical protein